jgi:selT/selW/selH-like putative selenoprotein
MVLVPSDKGKFELFLNGEEIHSKLKSGSFPDPREVVRLIEARTGK